MPDPSDPTDTETAAGERGEIAPEYMAGLNALKTKAAWDALNDAADALHDENLREYIAENFTDPRPFAPLPAPVREPDEAAAGLAETELARVFSDIDAMGNTSTYRRLAAEFLRSDWLAQYTAKARAEAWDEGHDTDEHGSDNCECPNPYRGGAR